MQNTIPRTWPRGGINIIPNEVYTLANLATPGVGTGDIETVILTKGVAFWEEVRDYQGKVRLKRNNEPRRKYTGVRGVRVRVTNSGLTFNDRDQNKPTIWKEFDELVFKADYEYVFLDEGTIELGTKVV